MLIVRCFTAIFWRIRLAAKSAFISFNKAMAASWSRLSKALEDVSSALSISLMEAVVSETALSKASRSQRTRSTSVSPSAFGADSKIDKQMRIVQSVSLVVNISAISIAKCQKWRFREAEIHWIYRSPFIRDGISCDSLSELNPKLGMKVKKNNLFRNWGND